MGIRLNQRAQTNPNQYQLMLHENVTTCAVPENTPLFLSLLFGQQHQVEGLHHLKAAFMPEV
jgi:hypothetical protein